MAMRNTLPWPVRFAAWAAYAANLETRARRVADARRERAFDLAESVGLPRHATVIHNASIDTGLTGWCHQNPQRLRVAKRCAWMLSEYQFQPTRIASRVVQRAFDRLNKEA